MDDPIPIPELLANRPALAPDSGSTDPRIHAFDPTSQKAEGCPDFEGLHIWPELLDPSEASALLEEIEQEPFVPAQSGKLKQHYGPKINFNKRKMNAAKFAGIPEYARALEARLRDRIESDRAKGILLPDRCEAALDAYETTDVFVLRYRDEWMSNLDFHCDDRFGYGEGIIDVSLESDSVLSFLTGDAASGDLRCVRASLPARSAAFLYGPARFDWEHAILAYDITGQRTSITLRTLGDALRATEGGRAVVERARGQHVSRRSPGNPVA